MIILQMQADCTVFNTSSGKNLSISNIINNLIVSVSINTCYNVTKYANSLRKTVHHGYLWFFLKNFDLMIIFLKGLTYLYYTNKTMNQDCPKIDHITGINLIFGPCMWDILYLLIKTYM